jgi:predicted DNA-binding ArsR family transcriptional regulator
VTQVSDVKREIERLIDAGMTDKTKIYDTVEDNLSVPRPTIRRIARTLRLELAKKAEIIKDE